MTEFWHVGDRLYGAGTPVPGEPYSIPTAREDGVICRMEIVDIEMDGDRHYWGTVASISPYSGVGLISSSSERAAPESSTGKSRDAD